MTLQMVESIQHRPIAWYCMPFTNLEADVLPSSPLVSSAVDWIQLSRHVVPQSRVAIATQAVHRDWWRKQGSALAIAEPIPAVCKMSKMHEMEADPANRCGRKLLSTNWNPACIQTRRSTGVPSMAATALQLNPDPNAVECYQSRVQELTDIITHHSARFRRIALGHLSNVADAEDAVQDALLSALTHVHHFRGQAKMSTWLTTIVINSARMKLRRRLTSVQLPLDETDGQQDLPLENTVSDTRPGPEEAYREREIAVTLAQATSRLSPALRTTFQLRDIDGLSIRETSDLLGVPTGTIKARLARARVRLREVMGRSIRRKRERSYSRDGNC
jgi:RNA polymerase sigma-70 factor (ECF subfamily)